MRLRRSLLKPPPRLKISEWADTYRMVSAGNAEPGPWRTARAPYQREPMDVMCDPDVRVVTLMWGAQLGKTEIINNAIGYHIHQNPCSQMMMHPTQGDLQTWLETKLNPLLNDTPEIAERIAKPRGRDGVNNQRMKSYPGGFLMFSWSGSPNTMRGRSAPRIYCDEIDGYEMTSEGDPVELLWQRAATFGDQAQLVCTSTPTVKGASRIEKMFLQGDRRRYYLPCPHCSEYQTLKWGQVQWDKDASGEHMPDTARYVCEHCGGEWSDSDRLAALQKGEWRAERPFRGHASFHLSELYSPFRKFADVVTSFLQKKAAGDVQSFVNISLGETWDEAGETVEPSSLIARREIYPAEVPHGALLLVASADVQDDRIEALVVGAGHEREMWIIDHQVFYGDPGRSELWQRLDDYLLRPWAHASGVRIRVAAAGIDSGGHYTSHVYRFCKQREGRRVYALKGSSSRDAPLVSRPTNRNQYRAKLFMVGTDQAKDQVFASLQKSEAGAGYIHIPQSVDEEFCNQLTAEKRVTTYKRGFPVPVYKKIRPRNEALDLMVYALAVLEILQPDYAAIERRITNAAEPQQKTEQQKDDVSVVRHRRPVKRRSSFINDW